MRSAGASLRSCTTLAFAAALVSGACVLQQRPFVITQTTTHLRSATLPAAAGPIAAGGALREGELVLEGGATVNPVAATAGARESGAAGNQYTTANGGIRLLGRVPVVPIELGGAVDFAHTVTSAPSYAGVYRDERTEDGGVGRISLVGRVSTGGARWGFGLNVEGGLIASYMRVYSSTTVTRTYTDTRETTTRYFQENWSKVIPLGDFRSGLFFYARPVQRLTLSAGGMVQVLPLLEGFQRTVASCSGVGIEQEILCGISLALRETFDRMGTPNVNVAAMFTAWAAVGVDVGPVTLYAQGFVHPVAEQRVDTFVRGGAQVGAQLVFDTRNPRALRGLVSPPPSGAAAQTP